MSKENKIRTSLKAIFISSIILITLIIVIGAIYLISWDKYKDAWADRSIMTGSPCAPPCWQGTTPGITTRSQAMEILEKSPYIEKKSIEETGTETSGGCTWWWKGHNKRVQPGLSWRDGVVDYIVLGLTFELTVGEIIDRFGLPEVVNVAKGGIPEHWYWIVDLYYPKIGGKFKAYTNEFSNQFQPSTEVGVIELFAPSSMQEQINNSSALPWKGYGDLHELFNIQKRCL